MARLDFNLIPQPSQAPANAGVAFDTRAGSGTVNNDLAGQAIAQAGQIAGSLMMQWGTTEIEKEKKADLANAVAELEQRYTEANHRVEQLSTAGGANENIDKEIETIIAEADQGFDEWLGGRTPEGFPNIRWGGVREELDQVRKTRMAHARLSATQYVIDKSKQETKRRWERTLDESVKVGNYAAMDKIGEGMRSAGYDPEEVTAIVDGAKNAADKFRIDAELREIHAKAGTEGFDYTQRVKLLEMAVGMPEVFKHLSDDERNAALIDVQRSKSMLSNLEKADAALIEKARNEAIARADNALAERLFDAGTLLPKEIEELAVDGEQKLKWSDRALLYAKARAAADDPKKAIETDMATLSEVNRSLASGTLTLEQLDEFLKAETLSAADFKQYAGELRRMRDGQEGAGNLRRAQGYVADMMDEVQALTKAEQAFAGVFKGKDFLSLPPGEKQMDTFMVNEIVVDGREVKGWKPVLLTTPDLAVMRNELLDYVERNPDATRSDIEVYKDTLLFPVRKEAASLDLQRRIYLMREERRRTASRKQIEAKKNNQLKQAAEARARTVFPGGR